MTTQPVLARHGLRLLCCRLHLLLPLAASVALAATASGCAAQQGEAVTEPPAIAGPQVSFPPGTAVLVTKEGQVLPGRVIRQVAPDRVIVHYDGFGSEWDEAVRTDRVRLAATPGPASGFQNGEAVLVRVQNRDLLAKVVQQVGPDQWRVHYDGYGPEIAEAVGPDRIRRPFAGPSTYAVGEMVAVDVDGRSMPAKVIAVSAADRFIVRFASFGPEYDQEVTAHRLRRAGATDPAPGAADAAGQAGAGVSAAAEKGKAASPAPGAPPQTGDVVLVAARGGALHPATVVSAGAGTFRVRYEVAPGGPPEEDVAADRVVRKPAPLKGTKYVPNQLVFIEWHGMMFAGKVVKEHAPALYRVRFDGFSPETDEVVASKRLLPR